MRHWTPKPRSTCERQTAFFYLAGIDNRGWQLRAAVLPLWHGHTKYHDLLSTALSTLVRFQEENSYQLEVNVERGYILLLTLSHRAFLFCSLWIYTKPVNGHSISQLKTHRNNIQAFGGLGTCD